MKHVFALLGRPDAPTDGVADYCAFLKEALGKRELDLSLSRVSWAENGWLRALTQLFRVSRKWSGKWVLLQYTAMGWSRRGFPLGVVASIVILRMNGARCGVVFHEPAALRGSSLCGLVRSDFQSWVIRTLHLLARRSVFTIPLSTVSWLPDNDNKSSFIPLGPNIPENLTPRSASQSRNPSEKTVAVFCVSESPYGEREINDIAVAARIVTESGIKLRLIFVGRGTTEAKDTIAHAFQGTQIEVCNRGVCEAREVTQIFAESDAMLAVRGRLYLRRGSALAGLACGLPMVAYAGAAESTIIEEAGVALVPFGDQPALGLALRDVLEDPVLWQEMHRKNLRFQQRYLSWSVIAASFAGFLEPS